jgi:hypothetical protein
MRGILDEAASFLNAIMIMARVEKDLGITITDEIV